LDGSEDQAESLIIEYLSDPPPSFPLLIRVSKEVLAREKVVDAFDSLSKCKTYYDERTHLLIVSMPGPLHSAVERSIDRFWWALFYNQLSPELRENLWMGYVELRLHGSPILGSKKPQTKKKAPDRTVYFKDGCLNPVTVLFEVGVSQGDVDLKTDALNYLQRESNRGRPQLVVLINVEENKGHREEVLSRSATQQEIRALVDKFAKSPLKAYYAPDSSPVSEDSSTKMDLEVSESIDPTHWVGPLKVTLEFWRYVHGIAQREASWDVLPTPSESNPIITLRDFLPLQEHGRRTDILDEGYELDLGRIGEDITDGVIELATERAIRALRG